MLGIKANVKKPKGMPVGRGFLSFAFTYHSFLNHFKERIVFLAITPNGCVYETLGIAGFVPIRRHKRRCGEERS
ncbi:MAG: hypothetical protein JXA16_13170, partial [Bacteroidales bacterium]|nr:hypothetical protein [Bacteroidales bacterium]